MSEDLVRDVLVELKRACPGDSLAALDAVLRGDPGVAPLVVERVTPRLPLPACLERARGLVALGTAHLARRDAAVARALLAEALASLDEDPLARARAGVRLASAELALGHRAEARAALSAVAVEVVGSREEALAQELGAGLHAVGETLASLVASARAEANTGVGGADRVEVLARLLHVLNSAASGTSEPLYAILRAILEETQADRGFLLVYEAERLRFELGLARSGQTLAPDEFAFSTTIVERALEEGRCVVIPDVVRALPASVSESARDLGLEAALCAPLRVERRRPRAAPALSLPQVKNVAGVLYVDSTKRGRFREADAGFFEILADCAVLALRARAATVRTGETAATSAEPRLAQGEDPELARRYPEIVTRDPAMRRLLAVADRAARSEATILIRGESGTGKELLARALHRRGLRAQGPFEVLDGATLSEGLSASELFGHEKNAFTGATEARAGAFERANGGTIFIDHVGEMPLTLQAQLLRVLQEREVRRVGSDRMRKVDVRVVAATHRDLNAMVERGEFRHDLVFRLAAIELRIPPLRERRGDVVLLARHLTERMARESGSGLAIETEALVRLEEHAWPGNVRELENVLATAALHAEGGTITRAGIDRLLGKARSAPAAGGTLEDIERRAIEERLGLFRWNQAAAAKSLGLDRNTLRRKIVRYGIVREDGRAPEDPAPSPA